MANTVEAGNDSGTISRLLGPVDSSVSKASLEARITDRAYLTQVAAKMTVGRNRSGYDEADSLKTRKRETRGGSRKGSSS